MFPVGAVIAELPCDYWHELDDVPVVQVGDFRARDEGQAWENRFVAVPRSRSACHVQELLPCTGDVCYCEMHPTLKRHGVLLIVSFR